jgi:hypothetical protein
MAWIPAGVEYTTDITEPARADLRETLARMLRALDAAPSPQQSETARPQAALSLEDS